MKQPTPVSDQLGGTTRLQSGAFSELSVPLLVYHGLELGLPIAHEHSRAHKHDGVPTRHANAHGEWVRHAVQGDAIYL